MPTLAQLATVVHRRERQFIAAHILYCADEVAMLEVYADSGPALDDAANDVCVFELSSMSPMMCGRRGLHPPLSPFPGSSSSGGSLLPLSLHTHTG